MSTQAQGHILVSSPEHCISVIWQTLGLQLQWRLLQWEEDGRTGVKASLQLGGTLNLLKGQFFRELGMKEAKGISWPLRGQETEAEKEAREISLPFSCEISLQEAAHASAQHREALRHQIRAEAAG